MDKRISSKSQFWHFQVLWSKCAKFLISFSKLQVRFSSNFASLFSFHISSHFTSKGSFCPKYTMFELKKYRGVVFHGTKQCCKIWINPDLLVSNMAWGIGYTFIRALESLKNCTLMCSFCPKYIMFQRNYVSCDWRVTQNLKENWLVACKMS